MKKYLFLIFLFLNSSLYAQVGEWYAGKISEDQKEFRDYQLGIKVKRHGRLLIRTEPVFDRVIFSEDYIMGQISLLGIDNKTKALISNIIWVCLDNSYKLLFVFPKGTKDAGFDKEHNLFKYSTLVSMEYDRWFNNGLLDLDGNVIIAAKQFNTIIFKNDEIVSIYRELSPDENKETKEFLVTYKSVEGKHEPISFVLKAPYLLGNHALYKGDRNPYWAPIDFPSEISQDEMLFERAIDEIFTGGNLTEIGSIFKEASNSKDSLLNDCSEYNYNAIKNALRTN